MAIAIYLFLIARHLANPPTMIDPSPCEEYLTRLFDYLRRNDLSMDLNKITDKFGSIRKTVPKDEGKSRSLKKIIENDVKCRFFVETVGEGKQKGLSFVRAATSVLPTAGARSNTHSNDPPSTAKDNLEVVYKHLLQNDITMNVSDVKLKFDFVERFELNDTDLRILFDQDSHSRFVLDSFHNGINNTILWTVRAARSENGQSTKGGFRIHSHDTKMFKLDDKTKCYYVDNSSGLEMIVDHIQKVFDNAETVDSFSPKRVISIGCCCKSSSSNKNKLELLQIATSNQQVYLIDCCSIGKETVSSFMQPLVADQSVTKLIHDFHEDATVLNEVFGETPGIIDHFLDTQLLAELVWGNPSMGLNDFLSKLDLPNHSGRDFFEARQKAGHNPWTKRPIAQASLEYAASGVACLQKAAPQIRELLQANDNGVQRFEQLLVASSNRAKHSIENPSFRTLCFDTKKRFAPCSTELMRAFRPSDGFYGYPLIVESDVGEVLSILPPSYTQKFSIPLKDESARGTSIIDLFTNPNTAMSTAKASAVMHLAAQASKKTAQEKPILISKLSDICLDVNRPAHCWVNNSRVYLFDNQNKNVEQDELETIVSHLGEFGSDNRAGLDVGRANRSEGSLHRFSAMRDRSGNILGLTIRIGRHVKGNASMLMDLLMNQSGKKSILILGEPGSGKTTIVREASRELAEQHNVIVVDTSNEIAGDGNNPHTCIGKARRMMVPTLDAQNTVMLECVQNHTPQIMVIDEIGRPREVKAASTVKQRGVQMLASAHGDLRSLLKNGDLNGLIGGLEKVTIGDDMAKEQAREKQQKREQLFDGGSSNGPLQISKMVTQRRADPIFEIIVEVSRDSRHDWRIIHDSKVAVDQILKGLNYSAQLRRRDPDTGFMSMKQVES